MKSIKTLFFIAISVFFISFTVNANDLTLDDIQNEILSEYNLEKYITDDAKSLLGDTEISFDINIFRSISSIISNAKPLLGNILNESLSSFMKIFVVIIISSVAMGFISSNEVKGVNNLINIASIVTICTIILIDVKNVMNLSAIAIEEMNVFSKMLIPAMVTAITFSGSPTVAVLSQTASMVAFNLIISLIYNLLFPFTYIYIGVITVNSALGNDMLGKLAEFIKWFTSISLKIILWSFFTYMSVTGVVSGTIDSFAVNTTKFATGFIPVVGSIISNASETVLIGATIVKNAIGVFGILAISCICFLPIARVIINFLLFKLLAVFLSPISSKQIVSLFDGISNAFNMALAMLCSVCLVLFIMIIVGIMVVRQI